MYKKDFGLLILIIVVGTAVAIPVALHNADDDDPAS